MRRAELKTKMEKVGMVTTEKKRKVRGTREPRVNYTFVDWDPGKESFPCPTADHRLPSDGPAFERALARKEAFEAEVMNQSAARREVDKQQETGTLAAVLKERRMGRVRKYFNTTVKAHEEEEVSGVVLDKAERKRRALLRKERRARLHDNPHGKVFRGSRARAPGGSFGFARRRRGTRSRRRRGGWSRRRRGAGRGRASTFGFPQASTCRRRSPPRP